MKNDTFNVGDRVSFTTATGTHLGTVTEVVANTADEVFNKVQWDATSHQNFVRSRYLGKI